MCLKAKNVTAWNTECPFRVKRNGFDPRLCVVFSNFRPVQSVWHWQKNLSGFRTLKWIGVHFFYSIWYSYFFFSFFSRYLKSFVTFVMFYISFHHPVDIIFPLSERTSENNVTSETTCGEKVLVRWKEFLWIIFC